MIEINKTNREIIDDIVSHNSEDHDILKLAEECTELSEVLIKMITKPNRREERMPHLIEELGDVEVRLDILKRRLGLTKDIAKRYESKLEYINKSICSKKYSNC